MTVAETETAKGASRIVTVSEDDGIGHHRSVSMSSPVCTSDSDDDSIGISSTG